MSTKVITFHKNDLLFVIVFCFLIGNDACGKVRGQIKINREANVDGVGEQLLTSFHACNFSCHFSNDRFTAGVPICFWTPMAEFPQASPPLARQPGGFWKL